MISQFLPFTKAPRSRSYKQEIKEAKEATHRVLVFVPGVGGGIDMEIFKAAGQYSDGSGCDLSTADRDHEFLVKGYQNALQMARNIRQQLKELGKIWSQDLKAKVFVKKIDSNTKFL